MKSRPATAADRSNVIALWTKCGLTRPWNSPEEDFDFAQDGPSSTVIVLEHDASIIGSAMVGHDGHRGTVYYVSICPDQQGRGLGAELMRAAEDWLRSCSIWKINLLVRRENSSAVRFYEELGYQDQDCIAIGKRLDGRADRSTT